VRIAKTFLEMSIPRVCAHIRHYIRRFAGTISRGKLWGVTSPAFENVEWLTVPDLVVALGVSQSKVRRLLEERHLVGIRREGGPLVVPSSFIRDGNPLTELHGTIIVLSDLHFSDEEILTWLLEDDDALGVAPIDALWAGRKAEVRRVAMTLA
jgi:hypothetical protein